jgi:PhzF family phenazine biosynthesis protein
MQSVAMEMKQSETAFIVPQDNGFGLRWFTPLSEVDLCGHATLASAHTMWEMGSVPSDDRIVFHTRSGALICSREGDLIAMDFPAERAEAAATPPELEQILGDKIVWYGANRMDVIAELESEEAVRTLSPDFGRLADVEARGVMVTAPGSGQVDFISRFFAPRFGIPEDPVTGSAHCCLGPYWAAKLGREEVTGYQASKRGGFVQVHVRGDRVTLKGRAITILRGELCPNSS